MYRNISLLALAAAFSIAATGTYAAPRSRVEVAKEIKQGTDALKAHRAQASKAVDGKGTLDAADGARFRVDFSRAVALYEQYPNDDAALVGLTYDFIFCEQPPRAKDRAPCAKVMPRAQRIALKHWPDAFPPAAGISTK